MKFSPSKYLGYKVHNSLNYFPSSYLWYTAYFTKYTWLGDNNNTLLSQWTLSYNVTMPLPVTKMQAVVVYLAFEMSGWAFWNSAKGISWT